VKIAGVVFAGLLSRLKRKFDVHDIETCSLERCDFVLCRISFAQLLDDERIGNAATIVGKDIAAHH